LPSYSSLASKEHLPQLITSDEGKQPVREVVNDRGLFTAGWFGGREKHCSRLEIYDHLRASKQTEDHSQHMTFNVLSRKNKCYAKLALNWCSADMDYLWFVLENIVYTKML